MNKGRIFRLFAVEASVAGAAAVAVVLYLLVGIPLRDPFRLYLEKVEGGLVWYATGLPLCLLVWRLLDLRRGAASEKRISWRQSLECFHKNYLRPGVLWHDFRLVHALALSFVIFIQLKHLIPFLRDSMYDRWFYEFEAFLCGGELCSSLVLGKLGPDSAQLMSSAYLFFFPYMGFLLMTMVLQRNASLAREFCFSFSLVWFLGILLVYAVPTLGPCYFASQLFSKIPQTEVTELVAGLWKMKQFVESSPNSPKGAYLISGFPSLHLTVPVLGSLYLKQVCKPLAVLSWMFCALTALTTLYFGWHYLLDDLGAVILAVFVYVCVRRWASARSDAL